MNSGVIFRAVAFPPRLLVDLVSCSSKGHGLFATIRDGENVPEILLYVLEGSFDMRQLLIAHYLKLFLNQRRVLEKKAT